MIVWTDGNATGSQRARRRRIDVDGVEHRLGAVQTRQEPGRYDDLREQALDVRHDRFSVLAELPSAPNELSEYREILQDK